MEKVIHFVMHVFTHIWKITFSGFETSIEHTTRKKVFAITDRCNVMYQMCVALGGKTSVWACPNLRPFENPSFERDEKEC